MSSAKRTYASRSTRDPPVFLPSSPHSELTSSPPCVPSNRKRSQLDDSSLSNLPPTKRRTFTTTASSSSSNFFTSRPCLPSARTQRKPKKVVANAQKQLTQLHFSLETSVLRTCSLCSLTYTTGAPDDETLHRAHCARVQRGMEWGKEEERECKSGKIGVEEVASGIRLKNGTKGRIVCFRADAGGKIGAKLGTLLETINITLSAPALARQTLRISKVYLFLLAPGSPSATHKEKIVGCVVAQRISIAMDIAPHRRSESIHNERASKAESPHKEPQTPSASEASDSSSITLIPTPLPTPLGISRLFVSSSHRRLGIGSRLLTAAASTFVHGCPLDPKKGEVAFSQPTGLGGKVLEKWAGGKGRVFEETWAED
ncbi:hypothetical protein BC835DRAFT_1512826 [Cytidiella melzeri]|nr:hypothetical protein BC835DRAFT_1512826 [Cytidiella melzeri]